MLERLLISAGAIWGRAEAWCLYVNPCELMLCHGTGEPRAVGRGPRLASRRAGGPMTFGHGSRLRSRKARTSNAGTQARSEYQRCTRPLVLTAPLRSHFRGSRLLCETLIVGALVPSSTARRSRHDSSPPSCCRASTCRTSRDPEACFQDAGDHCIGRRRHIGGALKMGCPRTGEGAMLRVPILWGCTGQLPVSLPLARSPPTRSAPPPAPRGRSARG